MAAPPYDVVTREQAAARAAGNPESFLHVARAEIDLPADVEAHDPRVYARARAALDRFVAEGVLGREERPVLYLYRQATAARTRVGVAGCVHVDDYASGVIRRHEATRSDKEDDRTRHMLALDAHPEPVLLAYRGRPELDRLVKATMAQPPLHDFTADDGVRQTVWSVTDTAPYVEAFRAVPTAYVADGHHRSAAAWRMARERRASASRPPELEWFPAVLVPAAQLEILAYHRAVVDLGGQTVAEVLEKLGRIGRLSETDAPAPARPGGFGVYVRGRWRRLELPDIAIAPEHGVSPLDASLLQERVLGPVLGIGDHRTDARIDFVGGVAGIRELQARVDAGAATLAFALYPARVEQLMAVSDAGRMMPPKSTWFEPKLLSGLFVHALD